MNTPWGKADHVETIYPGIVAVSTPSHGGLKLDRAVNARMPDHLRLAGGWYEEDCEWARVARYFPGAFPTVHADEVLACLRSYAPDAYEHETGRTLRPGESYVRDCRQNGMNYDAHLEATRALALEATRG